MEHLVNFVNNDGTTFNHHKETMEDVLETIRMSLIVPGTMIKIYYADNSGATIRSGA